MFRIKPYFAFHFEGVAYVGKSGMRRFRRMRGTRGMAEDSIPCFTIKELCMLL